VSATNGHVAAEAPPAEDEDWFGEGSMFESSEDLAAALFALAETADPAAGGQVAPAPRPEPVAETIDPTFEVFEPLAAGRAAEKAPAPPAPNSWGLRKPGTVLLPPKRPGHTGWTIRNSVQVLHQTEEAMAKLREQAVTTAFLSAAEAFRIALPRQPAATKKS
jgi:hypothetical protein